jgi:hypothetical protein
MATIEDALAALVIGSPAVAALQGERFYPVEFPDAPVYPASVYLIVGLVPFYHSNGESGLSRGRIQIDVYALSYDEVTATALAIRQALSAFAGMVDVAGSDPVEVQTLLCTMDRDVPESGLHPSGVKVRRRQLEFTVLV